VASNNAQIALQRGLRHRRIAGKIGEIEESARASGGQAKELGSSRRPCTLAMSRTSRSKIVVTYDPNHTWRRAPEVV